MRLITLDMRPDRLPGHWRSTERLVMLVALTDSVERFAVTFVDPTGVARRVHDGPILPGPYASLVPIPHEQGPRKIRLVQDGDVLRIRGREYRIEDDATLIPTDLPRLAAVA